MAKRISRSPALLLVASVLLNLVLLWREVRSRNRSCTGGERVDDFPFAADRTLDHTNIPMLEASGADDLRCLRQQLEVAETAFQRNRRRRSLLVGSTTEQAFPLSRRAYHAFASVRDVAWQSQFLREYFFFPQYPCPQEERVGSWGDGGKWVCMLPLRWKHGLLIPTDEDSISPGPAPLVVYSVGSNGDSSFETGVWELFRVRPHTFDPFLDPDLAQRLTFLPWLHFHSYGLATDDSGRVKDTKGQVAEGKTIVKIMNELNHSFVDVLKIDCEGCEVELVRQLVKWTSRTRPLFGQVLMEVHDVSKLEKESELTRSMLQLGYRLFHLEPNFFDLVNCFELAYIHESFVKPELALPPSKGLPPVAP